ncbi:hypothetical protein BD779DRAFT_13905 [Infundibulicybe gibba]|nr:hypothetical protein BD779DRAFT_13905 [Infundibulicybe gibba]
MIDGALFDKLLVLSGDFCQLPPVPNYTNGQQIPPLFAFEAQTWNQCVGAPVTLTRVFRQKDQEFVDMLNAMRFGTLDPVTIAAFQRLSRAVVYTDGIEPTELYPTRAEVERANTTRLAQLPGAPRQYIAHQRPGVDSKGDPVGHMQMERILERLVVPASIQLKAGAQVMLVKNLIQGVLVNGSVGKVMRFMRTTEARKTHTPIAGADPLDPNKHRPEDGVLYPLVQFINGNEMLCVPQEFTVDNASGGMEACREQVRALFACVGWNDEVPGAAYPGMGAERTQVAGADAGTCQGRPTAHL